MTTTLPPMEMLKTPQEKRPEFLEPTPVSPRAKMAAAAAAAPQPYEIESLYRQADFLENLLYRITKNVGLSAQDFVRYCDAEAALEEIYARLEEYET